MKEQSLVTDGSMFPVPTTLGPYLLQILTSPVHAVSVWEFMYLGHIGSEGFVFLVLPSTLVYKISAFTTVESTGPKGKDLMKVSNLDSTFHGLSFYSLLSAGTSFLMMVY